MNRKKQKWETGDIFLVELQDGKYVLGQIVGHEVSALNSASCAFFNFRVSDAAGIQRINELPVQNVFSVLFVTRDLLDSGKWKVVGARRVSIPKDMQPFEDLREKGFVGAKITGSGIVVEFLNAFYGLLPWDDWHDPQYLDSLLISKEKKPVDLVFKRT
jgi:Immunity protein 26